MEISAVETPRRSSDSSTEFEFWMVGNHPQPLLLTADELFVDGVLLPLHSLSLPRPGLEPEPEPAPDPPPADDSAPASICSAAAPPSGSKRWKDIFRVGEKKAEEKERKKERNNGSGAAELNININIWPFSRSRSAGNGGAGVRTRAVTGRMASSAPCSRSNSRGESAKTASSSTARRCAASPGRAGLSGGVHLGRTSPVWHVRRTARSGEPAGRGPDMAKASGSGGRKGSGGRVLSLNVNTCIGYRSQVSCRGDENDEITGGARSREARDGSLFNLRTLFTKKVY